MDLKIAFNAIQMILSTQITLYGFTFSLLEVVLFLAFASICAFVAGGILNG